MHFASTLKLLQKFLDYPKVFKRPYTHAINDTKPKATNSGDAFNAFSCGILSLCLLFSARTT